MDLAATIGLALRLGYLLTGGALSLLRRTRLELAPKRLTLHLKEEDALASETIHDALSSLAARMGRQAVI